MDSGYILTVVIGVSIIAISIIACVFSYSKERKEKLSIKAKVDALCNKDVNTSMDENKKTKEMENRLLELKSLRLDFPQMVDDEMYESAQIKILSLFD